MAKEELVQGGVAAEFNDALQTRFGGVENRLLMSIAQGVYGLDGPVAGEDVIDHLNDARRTIHQLQRDGYCIVRLSELSQP
jgi:hypothetical protein